MGHAGGHPGIRASNEVTPSTFEMWLGLPPNSVIGEVRRTPLSDTATSSRLFRLFARTGRGEADIATMILKLPILAEDSRAIFSRGGHYQREAEVYCAAESLALTALPKCYSWSEWCANEPVFHLALEDCAGNKARQFNLDDAWGRTHLEALCRTLASIHSSFWEYRECFPHLKRWSPGLACDDACELSAAVQKFKTVFASRLSAFEVHALDTVAAAEVELRAAISAPPTLIHGDVHPLNVFFATDEALGPVKLVDWQFAGWGAGAADMADMLQLFSPPLERRLSERQLVELYYASLVPSIRSGYHREDLFQDYAICRLLNVLKPTRLLRNPKLPVGIALRLFKRACVALLDETGPWPMVDDLVRRACHEFSGSGSQTPRLLGGNPRT